MKFSLTNLFRPVLAYTIAAISVVAISIPAANAAGVKQMPMQAPAGRFDYQGAATEREQYFQWLLQQRVSAASKNPLIAVASDEQIAGVDGAPKQTPEIVGFTQNVRMNVDFRDIKTSRLRGRAESLQFGAVERTTAGGFVYSAELASPGAIALRVQFAGFNLPAGAAIFLYTEEGQVFGPYTGKGPLGTGQFESNTLAGDRLTLQLQVTDAAGESALRDSHFQVVGLGHIRPRFMSGQCSYNANCVQSANCDVNDVDPAVIGARYAVAHMLFPSGGFYYICSGGLIADTDTSNNLPLFLTANHCISRGREANSLENFFQFFAKDPKTGDPVDACDNETLCNASYTTLRSSFPRTLGASIVTSAKATDFTLLRLAQPAPAGSVFLGWNPTEIAFTDGVALFRISHPQGAPQSYSEHVVDTSYGQCSSWPRGNRIYSRDILGATEGGSSGSPVVNKDGEIVGQLSGACGTNVNEECDPVSNATVDGAFAAYFAQVQPYLAPGGEPGCTVTEPGTEISCNDGEDNDCDGAADALDSDCTPGGGAANGASCTVDADCQSNHCSKGRPGTRICIP